MAKRTVRTISVGDGELRVLVYFAGDPFSEYKRSLLVKNDAIRRMKSSLMSRMYKEAVNEIWRVYTTEIFGERSYPPRASGHFGSDIGKTGSVQPQLGVLTITSRTPHAKYFMRSRQPHRPPIRALVPWAMDKFDVTRQQAFGIAYGLADIIEEQGSPGQPVFSTALGAGSIFRRVVRDMFMEYAEKAARAK